MKYKLRETAGQRRFICKVNVPSPYYYLSNIDEPKLFDTYNEVYQKCYSWNTNNTNEQVEIVDEKNNQISSIINTKEWNPA